MNERIKEIANKAGAEVKIIHGDILYISKADLDIEKFAELIVAECMNICAEREKDIRTRIKDEGKAATAYMIRAYIKERFGVKE